MSHTPTPPHAATWFEIPCLDLDRSQAFYESVLVRPLRREVMGANTLAVFPYAQDGAGGCLYSGATMLAPAASGTLIYAVADGVVSAASARPSYGNCVQIDHGTADDGSSYATLYAHMSSFCVSAGQTVHKGDVIGYVGNTGDVRGANGGYHLHLELREDGTRTDPLQYIPH